MDDQRPRKSFKRRLIRILAVFLVVLIAALTALPWLLSTGPARVAIVAASSQKEVADAIVWLASERASYITGTNDTGGWGRGGLGRLGCRISLASEP